MPVRLADGGLVQVRELELVRLLLDEVAFGRRLIAEFLMAGGAAGHHVSIGEDEIVGVLLCERFSGNFRGGDDRIDGGVPVGAFEREGAFRSSAPVMTSCAAF